MKYTKVRNVKSLTRGTSLSAGIDFYVPEFNQELKEEIIKHNHPENYALFAEGVQVLPHKTIMIPSGIKANPDEGTALICYNKSGVSSLKGLAVMGCVVSPSDGNEIQISLLNTTDERVMIEEGEKITQFIEEKVLISELVEVPIEELYEGESQRGAGAFGSTGTK